MDPDAPTARMGPDVARCTAITQAGNPGPRAVQPGTQLCWTHGTPIEERRVIGGRRDPKVAPATGATSEEAEVIARELTGAKDAAAIQAVLGRVAALALTGRITPRVATAVSQTAGVALRALQQDHEKEMDELHKILDAHESEKVRGWSRRRRQGARA